ncbi:hypothetical protein AVEN_177779-1 [Araneus ventricosus]|uniref:Uncharacterized protein n=1 Tax=Araneus ventricosus TaxID=182803 RepID=A0A4Y2RG63_ARAVE|nr:hypothetical protein AVEN_177779-1 [Araneus ventricosus]
MEARGEPESQPQRKKISTYSTGDLANPDSKESLSKRFWKPYRRQGKLPFPTENSLGNRRFDTIAAQLFINAASECDNCIQGQSENKRRTVMHYLHNGKFTESSKKRRIPDYGFGGHQNWLDQRGWDLAIRPENNIQGGDESYRFSSIHDLLYKGRM